MTSPSDYLAFLAGQRQTRVFTNEPVSDADLHSLLEIMRATGSAGNSQPWRFIVVRDPATKEDLSQSVDSMHWIAGAPLVLVVVTEGAKSNAHLHDIGRMDERILLTSQALGLAAGIVSFWNAAAQQHGRAVLHLPDDWALFSAVGIGHPTKSLHRTGKIDRKPLEELVFHDRFDS